MHRFLIVLITAISLSFAVEKAMASVVITVGDGTRKQFKAGEAAILPIFATNGFGFDESISNFALGFDLSSVADGYDGNSLPGGGTYFAFNSATFQSSSFSTRTVQLMNPAGRNYNVLISASNNTAVNFAAGQTIQLGTLSFDINLITPSGTFGFKYQPTANLDGVNENIFGGFEGADTSAGGGAFNNQFEVEAIPEPTTMTLLAIGLAGGVACRRFRKRSSSVGPGTTDPSTNGAKV